jgi:hypothetical protein
MAVAVIALPAPEPALAALMAKIAVGAAAYGVTALLLDAGGCRAFLLERLRPRREVRA